MVAKFKENKKNRIQRKSFFLTFGAILVVAVIIILIVSNLRIKKERTGLTNRIDILINEIEELEKRNYELKENINESGNEDYLEKVAREQLDLKKPGEEVMVISKEKEEEKKAENAEKKGWWEKLKSVFNFLK